MSSCSIQKPMQHKNDMSRRFATGFQLTWLGCKALGPLTFLDFSNCGWTLVIWPKALIKDNLCSTWKTKSIRRNIWR